MRSSTVKSTGTNARQPGARSEQLLAELRRLRTQIDWAGMWHADDRQWDAKVRKLEARHARLTAQHRALVA
jgi:hypothetical protein